MPLRDLLKKKEHLDAEPTPTAKPNDPLISPPIPEFTFVRTTTNTHEIISPPSYPGDTLPAPSLTPDAKTPGRARRLSNLLHRPKQPAGPGDAPSPSSNPSLRSTSASNPSAGTSSAGSTSAASPSLGSPEKPKQKRRTSALNIKRNRASTGASEHVPENLPDAPLAVTITPASATDRDAGNEQKAAAEATWEKRATLLAETESRSRSRSISSVGSDPPPRVEVPGLDGLSGASKRPELVRKVSDQQGDVDIQTAIRLHDSGQLEQATGMFRKLANPQGLNNALGQVLYGLALQHGWGCPENKEEGLTYLSLAAKNSASIESVALSSGAHAGGAAKGELVLAIFEMAQCFRNGWGCQVDKAAARQYYETAANLGDTDAMSEAAWCYLEGFGGAKDKWKAAQYLRQAETKGKKELGNTWIWKGKYDADANAGGKGKREKREKKEKEREKEK